MTTYAIITEDEKYCFLVTDDPQQICEQAVQIFRPILVRQFRGTPELVAQVLVDMGYKVKAVGG